jgi:hypothetical protein
MAGIVADSADAELVGQHEMTVHLVLNIETTLV